MGEPTPQFQTFDFAYGKAVGAGIQKLLSGETLGEAYLTAFITYDMDFLAGVDIFAETKNKNHHKKSFPFVLDAITKFVPHMDVIGTEWELFYFLFKNEKGEEVLRPAIELSAIVHFPNNFRYRIYIDVVLRNKNSGQLLVLELKTTGANYVQESMYGNSNQALSYSVILDKIAPGNTSFFVWYFVYSTTTGKWEFFPFSKSRLQKANWIRTVLYDTGNIEHCLKVGFFPQQGENCHAFGRPCEYYGACGMSNKSLYAGPHVIAERVKKELETKYDFEFTLEEIVDQQIEEIEGVKLHANT